MNLGSEFTTISVAVERETRTGDGAGGKTKTWATVSGLSALTCTKRFYGRTSQLDRLEQGAHNTAGPGVEVKTSQLFIFRQQPAPDIRKQDRLFASDGVRYRVLFTRLYATTLQVDTELVA